MIYPFKWANDAFRTGAECDFLLSLGTYRNFHSAKGLVQKVRGVVAHDNVQSFELIVSWVLGTGSRLAGIKLSGHFLRSGEGFATNLAHELPETLNLLVEPQSLSVREILDQGPRDDELWGV